MKDRSVPSVRIIKSNIYIDCICENILCFWELVARVKNKDDRKDLIFHLLDDIKLLAAPNIVNLLAVGITSTSQDRMCIGWRWKNKYG